MRVSEFLIRTSHCGLKTGMLVQFCIETFEGKRVSWPSPEVGMFHEKIIKCTEFFLGQNTTFSRLLIVGRPHHSPSSLNFYKFLIFYTSMHVCHIASFMDLKLI